MIVTSLFGPTEMAILLHLCFHIAWYYYVLTKKFQPMSWGEGGGGGGGFSWE